MRCFTFTGVGETADVGDFTELDYSIMNDDNNELQGKKRKVWRAKWDGDHDSTRPYLSVNATTIDFREDFDLRFLTEEKRVMYLDGRSEPKDEKEARWDRPHHGGCY